MASNQETDVLNGICPYFTMFPLSFPKGILTRHARSGQRVLDPFCGRGTTNFAARLLGLETLGIDSSPVAAAITSAKLAATTPASVIRVAASILERVPSATVPEGPFWDLAYHRNTLQTLCRIRVGLIENCSSDARRMLRGILLGALHGPLQKTVHGYLSNQCTRTYAPKPAYAIRYWHLHRLRPPDVDVVELIRRKACRLLAERLPACLGDARLGDSREPSVLEGGSAQGRFDWIITSPPYYGMRTYLQDQWLRNWFLGGRETVDYTNTGQVDHASPTAFSEQLSMVWHNAARVCRNGARLVIRFGGICDRKANPLEIVQSSLRSGGWRVMTLHSAGRADRGKRQANAFLRRCSKPLEEYDLWACVA